MVAAPVAATSGPAPSGPLRGPRRRRSAAARSAARSLPLIPAAGLMLVFLAGPIVSALFGSFTNSSLSGAQAAGSAFVGVANYAELLHDPNFPTAVVLTVVFVLGSAVIGQNVLGLALALLMRAGSPLVRAVVGTIVVTAWVLPEIVAAFAAYAFFQPDGTLNSVLAVVGVKAPSWLYVFPMLSVVAANIWRGTAFSMLVYSAALSDVPPEITEAAEMDGASGARRLASITIPMIRRTIMTNSMIVTLQTLSVFTLIFVMTGGGPGNASTTLPLLAYQQAFKFGDLGYGTAIAVVLLLVGALFSVFYIRALNAELD